MDLHTIHTQGGELLKDKLEFLYEMDEMEFASSRDKMFSDFKYFLHDRETVAWNSALEMVREKIENKRLSWKHPLDKDIEYKSAYNKALDVLKALSTSITHKEKEI